MWIFYIALILFVLSTAYFFIFPLSKKRPVLIRRGGFVVYSIVLTAVLYPLLETRLLVGVIVIIAIFLLSFKLWFVYGVTEAMILEAFEKAASATRSPIEKLNGVHQIDNSLKARLYNLAAKTYIISFRKKNESKKARLTVAVFKKFIQNYFV